MIVYRNRVNYEQAKRDSEICSDKRRKALTLTEWQVKVRQFKDLLYKGQLETDLWDWYYNQRGGSCNGY
jgi:hypothetical protein